MRSGRYIYDSRLSFTISRSTHAPTNIHIHTHTPATPRTMMDTHEFVVPRSIPITSPISLDLNRLVARENDESTNAAGAVRTDDDTVDHDDDEVRADRRSKRDEVDSILDAMGGICFQLMGIPLV
jgi:hypothetical protein